MHPLVRRFFGALAAGIILGFTFTAIARAEPTNLEVQTIGAGQVHELENNVAFTPSSTATTFNSLELEGEATTTGFHACNWALYYGVTNYNTLKQPQEGKEHTFTTTSSLFVQAGAKIKVVQSGCGTFHIFDTVQEVRSAEIKAGATGPTGSTGSTGATGAEGKGGAEGKEGKEGGAQLSSFGTKAEGTLSELQENGETIGFCIIGCMIGLFITYWIIRLLSTRRED